MPGLYKTSRRKGRAAKKRAPDRKGESEGKGSGEPSRKRDVLVLRKKKLRTIRKEAFGEENHMDGISGLEKTAHAAKGPTYTLEKTEQSTQSLPRSRRKRSGQIGEGRPGISGGREGGGRKRGTKSVKKAFNIKEGKKESKITQDLRRKAFACSQGRREKRSASDRIIAFPGIISARWGEGSWKKKPEKGGTLGSNGSRHQKFAAEGKKKRDD